ncbi:pentapeptide repeat-containing protein [Adhaeribacter rhizoryzae]|uniref:Pentapeptide repeat-containing protein n=1 Tax=Adhaeribacter rhizoryzae TaxID=2607907 RepID=A0A5M6D5T6_9BACT|nr:pentapeptide repeat-containing protein [Adhaeribacter rhizoryzae]KAA5542851.1 hypothetical protein F0145_18090 [Adhaeribacter rhizoryzae]
MLEENQLVKSCDDLLKLLNKKPDTFDLSWCEIQLDFNLYEFIQNNPIDGIEIRNDIINDNVDDFLPKISPGFYCCNLIFKKPVSFFQSTINGPTNIRNVIFEQGITIITTSFHGEANFFNTRIETPSIFRSLKINKSISFIKSILAITEFSNSIFEENIILMNSIVSTPIDFTKSTFNKNVSINNVAFAGKLDFSNSIINSIFSIRNDITKEYIKVKEAVFSNTIFNGKVNISKICFEEKVITHNAIFHESIIVKDITFRNKAYFTYSTFNKNIDFENTIIEKHLSFAYSRFKEEVKLREINFESAVLSFTGVQIDSAFWLGSHLANGISKKFDGTISFQGAIIGSGSIVRIFEINSQQNPVGTLKFTNAIIRGLLDIRNVFLSSISFDGTVVSGNIQDNNTLSNAISDCSTARLLKHEARKINNNISALNYHKIEMIKFSKNLKSLSKGDAFLLFMNKISNNYGLDWGRAVVFTFSSGLVFYCLFIMSSSEFGFPWTNNYNFLLNDQTFWAGFINYFWLPTGFNELTSSIRKVTGGILGALCGILSSFFFILGKILIAYGIYQTVAAFRKYV